MTNLYVDLEKYKPEELKRATKWAKKATNRILSHWTEEELEKMRKTNTAIRMANRKQ